jgi:hypothetical protein
MPNEEIKAICWIVLVCLDNIVAVPIYPIYPLVERRVLWSFDPFAVLAGLVIFPHLDVLRDKV